MEAIRHLPHRRHADVDDEKLTGYLLNDQLRRTHRDKVGLVVDVLGFHEPQALRSALYSHAQAHPAFLQVTYLHEAIYNVVGPLAGPRGRVDRLVTAWSLMDGTTRPRFVTLFPERRRRPRMEPW